MVMDMFKGQYNDDLRELYSKNSYEIVIIPNNLTIKFQPHDVSVNEAANAYVSKKYNIWMTIEFQNNIT